ncbi:MAG: Zn-dependent hydrolase [Candidatus Dormiibacterota bacterium]
MAGEQGTGRAFADIMRLAELVEPGQPGWTRRVFSPEYRSSRALVAELMGGAGLTVTQDAAGNLIGKLPSDRPEAPALVLGSHTDTVLGGGRFDGMAGVAAAIEVARRLRERGQPLTRPLWVVDFLGEEPNAFGISCVGSRAVAGALTREHLGLEGPDGRTLADALSEHGADPERIVEARWASGVVGSYLELHVEQGPRLERAGLGLGVVTAIAGIHRAEIRLVGRADHAGTTPMGQRRDALLAAAEVCLALEAIGSRDELGVATVGHLVLEPNSANVVAELVTLVAEYRSSDPNWLTESDRQLVEMISEGPSRRGVQGAISWLSQEPPTACSEHLMRLLTRAVGQLGEEPLALPSGAGHDAVQIASLCPVGMLFIPSRDGRSHCPEEWTEPDQVELGVRALEVAALELLSGGPKGEGA